MSPASHEPGCFRARTPWSLYTARFLIYEIFNDMGFLMHGRSIVVLRTVKLYFSVLVQLYTVFSIPKTLVKNPGQKSGQRSGQKSGQKPDPAVNGKRRIQTLFVIIKRFGLYLSALFS